MLFLLLSNFKTESREDEFLWLSVTDRGGEQSLCWSLSVPWVLAMGHGGGPGHLPHKAQILISEAGRLEVPSHVICRLHQISLPHCGSPCHSWWSIMRRSSRGGAVHPWGGVGTACSIACRTVEGCRQLL